jgi:two-component system, OmpR family, phosphate regulon sensor histidine kinase PhoR
MGISNKMVWIATGAMVVALIGLIGLQASLLRSSLELKEQSFRQNVQAAMAEVSRNLETAETVTATLHVIGSNYEFKIQRRPDSMGFVVDTTISDTLKHLAVGLINPTFRDGTHPKIRTYCDSVSLTGSLYSDSTGVCATSSDSTATAIMIKLTADTNRPPSRGMFVTNDTELCRTPLDTNRVGVIQRVIERLETGENIPLESRLKQEQLDSLVSGALSQYGVTLDPVYAVLTEGDTALNLSNRPGFDRELRQSEFKTRLFPNDIFSASNDLVMFFPDRASYLFLQIGPMLVATIIFMVVIVSGFAYAVKTIVGQRRAARHMVDFVNNMTHEFKTPISTVALACEAILRPDVIADTDRVKRFSRMIQDENRRMRNQAEKILQMAALEEKEGSLQLTSVDVHNIIRNAVDSVRLQVEHRGGRISCDLRSLHPIIAADEVHLTGVIFNLLDNANKYSPEQPTLRVTTDDCDGGIRIIVADNGIGMKSEERRKIFDKYYRVQQGNVHEVKGFGLGLSYVALIVRAHHGNISVDSEPGKGTKMILWLPVGETVNKHDEVG